MEMPAQFWVEINNTSDTETALRLRQTAMRLASEAVDLAPGGSWGYYGISCRVGNRSENLPSKRFYSCGLRLARVPSAPAGK